MTKISWKSKNIIGWKCRKTSLLLNIQSLFLWLSLIVLFDRSAMFTFWSKTILTSRRYFGRSSISKCLFSTLISMTREFQQKVVIVGGGTGGLGTAVQLVNAGMKEVTIVEPNDRHYYQPFWTLVGAGMVQKESSFKPLKSLIPPKVRWINKSVTSFRPDFNQIILNDGETLPYDYLIVSAGLQIDWSKIPGLIEGLHAADSGVVSIYDYNYSENVFATFQRIKHTAKKLHFTVPTGIIKCAGAPQKIMWLLEDTLRQEGLRNSKDIKLFVPGDSLFGIKHYADQLASIASQRGIQPIYRRELKSIDVKRKIARFTNLLNKTLEEESYDFLHVCPPMSAPDFIKNSSLAEKDGWLEVDKYTLQSLKYSNVFGLGDCTNTPNGKTTAAITSQIPVLVHNLMRLINCQPLNGYYDGYASCPLILDHRHVLLTEFGYNGKLMETFDAKTGKFPYNYLIGYWNEDWRQRFFYFLKFLVFPFAYWNFFLRGYWYGPNGPFKPNVTNRSREDPPTTNSSTMGGKC